ncbi:hypothetical protein RFI_14072 [Reticulomyxa filosa]|uniref:Uncharacterized protein n=1 Tax=Reticulomyxa filosa TaxID=46433 RepID=X6NB32_RETFI|nr:hypothetical protein RFI_14072 [Reticulomyxa filosa]|eukprot:ETO23113.1 hypothetical protein RFI_14072 [Reticulomyxa filosa]
MVDTNRPYLNKLYELKVNLNEKITSGLWNVVNESELYKSCEEVLKCILETIRILPQPLRQVLICMKDGANQSPAMLLEWLLSVIFSPLLLNPDDWLLVIPNPPLSHEMANDNIQAIVGQLMHIVVALQSTSHSNNTSSNDITDEKQFNFAINLNQKTTVVWCICIYNKQ